MTETLRSTDPAVARQASPRRRWLVLAIVCLAQLMITLDTTIVNVALPQIRDGLHFSGGSLTWVVNAFLLTFGGLLLLAGRLGDLVGKRRILLLGLTIFTLASLLCGVAPTADALIIARFIQGVGAALQAAVVLAIIATEFPDTSDRARAMSAYVFVAVSGGSLGLLLGGALTQGLSWRWIFLVNLPIGVATGIGARRLVPADREVVRLRGIDWIGSGLVTGSMLLLVFAIVQASSHGWASAPTLIPAAATGLLIIALTVWERRASTPILPGRVLRLPGLMASSLLRASLSTAMFATFFLGALFAERVRHDSPLQTGLAFVPWTGALAIVSLGLVTRMIRRFGPLTVMVGGLLSAIAGLVLLATISSTAGYLPLYAVGYVLVGLGAGSSLTPMITLAMADVPPEQHGLASALTTVSQQIGGALGLAILSTLAASREAALRRHNTPVAQALTGGDHLAYLIGACIIAGSLLLGIPILRHHQRAAADTRLAGRDK